MFTLSHTIVCWLRDFEVQNTMVFHMVSENTEEMWRIERAWYFPGALGHREKRTRYKEW